LLAHPSLITDEREIMTRSRTFTRLASVAAAPLIALAVAACGGSSHPSAAPPTTSSGQPATVEITSTGLGQILVDSQGRTLYLFQKDTSTTSTCTGACAAAWPPLRATSQPAIGSGANAALVGTTPRSDGAPQVTYNGHPVYTFTGDQKPGDTNGEGVNAFGASWFALTPTGNQVSPPAPSSSTSGSGGGGGY
jgi:predicted lipoprotein with Yx(FWY)xxD motif